MMNSVRAMEMPLSQIRSERVLHLIEGYFGYQNGPLDSLSKVKKEFDRSKAELLLNLYGQISDIERFSFEDFTKRSKNPTVIKSKP